MKEFLHQHDVAFEGHDVADLSDGMERIRAATGGAVGTPAVIIDGEARIGFHPAWMRERLGLQRA